MDILLIQLLNGLASASSLFLVAVGLSIIFGVTRVVNFAHGSFYMLGAYLAITFTALFGGATSALGFFAGILLAAVAIGVIGALIEMFLLRRIYQAPELFQLALTFGVALIIGQLVILVFGPEDRIGPRAPGLDGAVTILGQRLPEYELLLIALGPTVLILLHVLFRRTRFGILVRAATHDREMVSALGVDQARLFTLVFALGAGLAGLGGALQLPREAITHAMDMQIIAEAFVVVVVGGLGSISGAFLAALVIGELTALGIWLLPEINLVLTFLIMAVVLVLRPYGLLGRPMGGEAPHVEIPPVLRPASSRTTAAWLALIALLLALPAITGPYLLFVATEMLCLVLLAMSLHFIMGLGGMASFGHAAYFGLGAYGAGLMVTYSPFGMETGLVAAPLLAGLGALLFGWFCVRRAGVYLAMLSLAFAQIVYAIAFQWYEVTGGDNGLIGIWPSPWASSGTVYYYLVLALVMASLVSLRRFAFAPFGAALRGCRDAPARAEAIGIDPQTQRWLAFVIAGTFAGLAGGLLAFHRGTIDPSWLSIPQSIDALVMVLLGGVQTLSGPIAGALVYHGLETWVSTLTRFWPLILGVIIVVLVIAFPRGLVGSFQGLGDQDERAA